MNPALTSSQCERALTERKRRCPLFHLLLICLVLRSMAFAQQASGPAEGAFGTDSLVKPVPTTAAKAFIARDITAVSLASYGHYKIFASGSGAKLYTSGVEYDRNSWGRFLGARFDYVAEFLPVVLLDAAVTSDIWGTPTTQAHQIVPGIGFSPIGFRLLWRDGRALKPYLLAKGGVLIFSKKELSQQATYENFSLQSSTGFQVKLTHRVDLRLGLFGDFHFSDAFIVPVNPGLDVMNATLGVTYHLGHPPAVH